MDTTHQHQSHSHHQYNNQYNHHQCPSLLHHNHHHYQYQLIKAVKDNDLSDVEELLRHGVNVDTRDVDGHTPLYWACCRGHAEVCLRLIRSGCDVTCKGKAGTTALMACADNGQEMCLRLLLQHPSVLLNDVSERGDTALHMAAYRGNPNIVRLLCQAGAHPGLHNANDQTPLGVAFIENHRECIKILNGYGQDHGNSSTGPSSSSQQLFSSPSPSVTSRIQSNTQANTVSPNSLNLEPFDPISFPVTRTADDEHLLSSDSALGLSVQSPLNSSLFVSHNSHGGKNDNMTSLSSNIFYPEGNGNESDPIRPNNSNNIVFQSGAPCVFTSNLHSPVETDERHVFKNSDVSKSNGSVSRSNGSIAEHFQSHTSPHLGSSHLSSKFSHNNAKVFSNHQPKTSGAMESIGYHSSGANVKNNAKQSLNPLDCNSDQGLIPSSSRIDMVHPPSFCYDTSMEDISGPPAICYSPAVERDNLKTIYSTANCDLPTPRISSSPTKRKFSMNNLSSGNKGKEVNAEDSSQYNIAFSKSDTIQKYTPNISPNRSSFVNQKCNLKELNVQTVNTDDTEVVSGMKMSPFLDSLQMKVVALEQSLNEEKTSKCDLQNDNKKLRQENKELRSVIEKLTQKLSKLS